MIKNAILDLENFYAYNSSNEYHMRRENEKFFYDRSVKKTMSLALFDDSEAKSRIPNRLKIEDIHASQHEKLIVDAQSLYNGQTFNDGI